MKVNNKFLNIESKSKKSQIEKEIQEIEDEKSKKIMGKQSLWIKQLMALFFRMKI